MQAGLIKLSDSGQMFLKTGRVAESGVKRNDLGTSFTFVPDKSESGHGDHVV